MTINLLGTQPIHYLAIDPGSSRTGWAAAGEDGTVLGNGVIVGEDEFLDWLEEQEFKVAIVETYRNRGNRHDSWSKMPVSQHVGAIKRILRKAKAEIVEQEPSPALATGLRFLGRANEFKGKHVPDEISATAHLVFYLRLHRIGIHGVGVARASKDSQGG